LSFIVVCRLSYNVLPLCAGGIKSIHTSTPTKVY
jgi:hypothetical protein